MVFDTLNFRSSISSGNEHEVETFYSSQVSKTIPDSIEKLRISAVPTKVCASVLSSVIFVTNG